MKPVPVEGATLATYSEGHGTPVIFLHGGPGDTHHYMKRMAEPLFKDFQCIFFDQRGTGASSVRARSPENFAMPLLLEDIKAVARAYDTGPVRLVGHSWGAMYGLYACMAAPELYTHAALLNMGPLDAEAEAASTRRIVETMTTDESARWATLRLQRNEARDAGDTATVRAFDNEMMRLRVKSWIYNPALHEEFLADYFQDPPPDRDVNKWIWNAQFGWFDWHRVTSVTTKIWLCAGDHDATPLEQFRRLAAALPNGTLTEFENCGHIPWLESPHVFYNQIGVTLG
ncbi:proline iminopeptidase-family hydrolase [soil metagenome]